MITTVLRISPRIINGFGRYTHQTGSKVSTDFQTPQHWLAWLVSTKRFPLRSTKLTDDVTSGANQAAILNFSKSLKL